MHLFLVLGCVGTYGRPVDACGLVPPPSKDYNVYNSVLTYLKEEQKITDPEVVHLDYEIGESKALLEVFPTTRVNGAS